MSIATLIPTLTGTGVAVATSITITPKPTGSASTGVSALRLPTAYADQRLGVAEYNADDVSYFVLASDIAGVTPRHGWTITDGSDVLLIRLATKYPYRTTKTFWQIDCKKAL